MKGCTYTALTEVEKTLNEAGVDTEIIHVGNKELRGCIGCRQCKKNGKCVFNDFVKINAHCRSYMRKIMSNKVKVVKSDKW